MKLTKVLFIATILGAGLFVSCTPESIEDGQIEQQIGEVPVPDRG